jgi:hypothetical protein
MSFVDRSYTEAPSFILKCVVARVNSVLVPGKSNERLQAWTLGFRKGDGLEEQP